MMTSTAHDTLFGPNSVGIALDLGAGYERLAGTYERLGYAALWPPGGHLHSLDPLVRTLRATSSVTIAPGIVSLDVHGVDAIASTFAAAERIAAGRLVLGLGGPQGIRRGAMRAMREAVAELEAAATPVPRSRRLLAALGPRKLQLAREQFAGAITLLVTPEFTRMAREALGCAVLIVQQMVVLETNADRARAAARVPLGFLATVPGYAANFRRMGFTDSDIECLSDRLVDAVVAWGDRDQIAERFAQHRRAGADHLVLSLLPTEGGLSAPVAAERLAPVLLE